MEFSERMNRFEDEIFASLTQKKIELEAKGMKTYNMFVGTPDFETPEYIRNALIEAAKNPNNWKYSLRDIDELLQAVVDYYQKRFGVAIEKDMICSCNGSQDGLGHISLVLCNQKDTVLLPTPCYPAFIAGANMALVEPYYYPMVAENNFLPDVKSIPEGIAKKAKYMIVSLPSNPTGSCGNDDNYKEIIEFAKKYDILIIHDNAYSDIIFDDNFGKSFLSYDGAKEVGVEFFSLSKSFNVTGARISFLIGRKDVVSAFKKLHGQLDFGMFLPIQHAAIAALTGPLDGVKKQNLVYQKRRDALCQGLRSIGWNVNDSHGSMFVWAPIPEKYNHLSSMEFCTKLVEESGVLVTPGSSFGPLGERYVRFALVLPEEKIKEVIKAIDQSGIMK